MKNRTIFSDVAILVGIGLFIVFAYCLREVNFIGVLLLGSSIIGSLFQFFYIAEKLLTFYFTKFRLYEKSNMIHIDMKYWSVPVFPLYMETGWRFQLCEKDSAPFQINKLKTKRRTILNSQQK